MNPTRTRRHLLRGAALLTTGGVVLLGSTPAFAQTDHFMRIAVKKPAATVTAPGSSSQASAQQKPAFIGPALDFFGFGAGIGLPLACQAGTSAAGSGANELHLAGQAGPYIAKVNDGCDTASSSGVKLVDQGRQMSQPANAINPYANAGLEATAGTVEDFGQQYDETLSPFGPTISGTGATLRWFEGR